MNVTISELLFGGDENIEYGELSEAMLHDLAVAEDPAVSSSALRELRRRGSPRFADAARELLESPATDPHLRADVLELSFAADPAAVLRYVSTHADALDRVVWESVVELMVMEAEFFRQNAAASCAIYARVRTLPPPRHPADETMLEAFEATYAQLCTPGHAAKEPR